MPAAFHDFLKTDTILPMVPPTIQQSFSQALQHHQAGRLHEAETRYRQILSEQPDHAGALHYLGVIANQTGKNEAAADLIRRSIVLKPDDPFAHNNLGNALQAMGDLDGAIAAFRQAIALQAENPLFSYNMGNALKDEGQLEEAIAAFRRAIVLKPNYADAHYNLGSVLIANGQSDEAIASYRSAISAQPNMPQAHHSLGNALKERGKLDDAIAAYCQAIALKPNDPGAMIHLGSALLENRQVDEAIVAYRQAITLSPDDAEAFYNLGVALHGKDQLDEAIVVYRHAIAIKPSYTEAYNNLGSALTRVGKLDEAIAACRQAVVLRPDLSEVHVSLGNALLASVQLDEAIAAYRCAIALQPELPEAHSNLATAILLQGKLVEGWEELEWRLKADAFHYAIRNFPRPRWLGESLVGRTILIHAEHGLGDTLQFLRYVPLVAERGGRIILECQAELLRLLVESVGQYPVLVRGEPLPAFDVHCPMMSLPRIFNTTIETIPRNFPTLRAKADDVSFWRQRLTGHSAVTKAGLCWAGNPAFIADRARSVRELSRLSPLAQVENVQFFSLQKGEAARQAKNPPLGMKLSDWTEDLHDFADTAALISELDLVISSDTSVVHLAGGMLKPVWVLLPFAPDWRWLLGRDDSPWYPSMRLFRQPSPGDWGSVVRQVVDELSSWRKTASDSNR